MKQLSLKNLNWGPSLFLIAYQLFAVIFAPYYLFTHSVSWSLISLTILFYLLGGLAITAGYHRLYSHRAYKVGRIFESILLFFGSSTMQGSAIRWSYDHRMHHGHVDTDKDPYSITRGFWYAHCLWILERPQKIDKKVVSDLYQNPLVRFQHRFSKLAMFGSNVVLFLLSWAITGNALGSFVLAVCVRLFFIHHCTWFINSLAHTWGDQPFSQEHTAVNNYVISLLTFGEGYHNFHHTYANDYRNGVRWYQFDPTKWLIWGCSKLGLAWALRRTDNQAIDLRIFQETKQEFYERLQGLWDEKKVEFEEALQSISERIESKLKKLSYLKREYTRLKQERSPRSELKSIKRELKRVKKSLRDEWRRWSELKLDFMKLQPA